MMKKAEVLGIITGRHGSKSVPRKNVRLLAGKPLVAWTIEEVKKSKLLTRVIVSTDDLEIVEIAKAYGVEVPFLRPAQFVTDTATDVEYLIHALDYLKEKEGYDPDVVLRLPPTSPLRTAVHIDEGIEKLLGDPELDAVRPITESPKHPYKMWKVSADKNYLEPFLTESFTGFKEPYNLPRQLFPFVYVHTGAMDVIRTRTLRKLRSTSGNKLGYFFMKPEDSVNIDSETDFDFADFLMRKRLKNH